MQIALYRHDNGTFGGIEQQVLRIMQGLTEAGCRVFLITTSDNSKLYNIALKTATDILVLDAETSMLSKAYKINYFLKSKKIGILQCHMFQESSIGKIVKLLNPKIMTIYRVHTYIDCSYIPRWKKNLYHLYSYLTDSLINYYVSINKYNIVEMRRRSHLPEKKLFIVNNAVPEIGVPDDIVSRKWPPQTIALVANISEVKRIDILINAIKLLADEGIQLKVEIFGATEDSDYLLKMEELIGISDLNDYFHFYGFTESLQNSLIDINVVVLTSESEGTPNCLIEAMSLKKIIVTTSVGGIPEFVKDMYNGILCSPNSVEEFAEGLRRMIRMSSGQMQLMAENAFATSREFSTSKTINGLLTVYSNRI